MEKPFKMFVKLAAALLLATALLPGAAFALATLEAPYIERNLADPTPAVKTWHSSIAHYNGGIIYAGNDGNIYSMDTTTSTSTLVFDTSLIPGFGGMPSGFTVVRGDHLYFHDNGTNPAHLYRIDLSGGLPVDIADDATLNTDAEGTIFSIVQNRFTGTVWFASGDYATGMLYLYEVSKAFDAATQKAAFAAPNGGGIGPVVFQTPLVALVGEAFFGANGYFHLVNTATGAVTIQNYMSFEGGLAAAINGYGNAIYAVSGDGNRLYRIEENRKILIQALPDEGAWGLAFDGDELFVANMDGLDFVAGGAVTFLALDGGEQLVAEVDLPDATPAPVNWGGSIGYYPKPSGINFIEHLIYAADDLNVYAYNIRTGASSLVLNADTLVDHVFAVSGFLVSDGSLYFHENTFTTKKIYRANLAAQWPITNIDELDTGADGSVFSFARNPWAKADEDRIWFASGDGADFYLYSIANDFSAVTKVGEFAAPHGGGNGPIIFMGPNRLLLGESVWADGNGYFHIVDTTTPNEIELEDYFTFPGGLSAAVHGRFFSIYAASGDGGTVYHLAADTAVPVVQHDTDGIRGLVFDGMRLFLGITDATGKPFFARAGAALGPLRQAVLKDMGSSDSSTCFVGLVNAEGARAKGLFAGLLLLVAVCFACRRAKSGL